jgi:hypothetical protein
MTLHKTLPCVRSENRTHILRVESRLLLCDRSRLGARIVKDVKLKQLYETLHDLENNEHMLLYYVHRIYSFLVFLIG